MKAEADQRDRLSVERTYVVQLLAAADIPSKRVAGRIEHVASGQAANFSSVEALVEFMARYGAGGIYK